MKINKILKPSQRSGWGWGRRNGWAHMCSDSFLFFKFSSFLQTERGSLNKNVSSSFGLLNQDFILYAHSSRWTGQSALVLSQCNLYQNLPMLSFSRFATVCGRPILIRSSIIAFIKSRLIKKMLDT